MDTMNAMFQSVNDSYHLLMPTDAFMLQVDESQWSTSHIWAITLFCTSLVGFTGIIPLFILPPDLETFGGLLGDVFLHLLPEAWATSNSTTGLWVVAGIFLFTTLEIFFTTKPEDAKAANAKTIAPVVGYLNVMANAIDNFAHGLAVAASFLVGVKIGILTTFAIVVHEVPHEFGDFAILIKSGFSKWEAAKAQMSTASIGLLGAFVALAADSTDVLGSHTAWILPFTAGGFLHVALIGILPELLQEDNPVESVKQMVCISAGVGLMALVNIITH